MARQGARYLLYGHDAISIQVTLLDRTIKGFVDVAFRQPCLPAIDSVHVVIELLATDTTITILIHILCLRQQSHNDGNVMRPRRL